MKEFSRTDRGSSWPDRFPVEAADVARAAPFAARWPLRSFLELGALPGAVPCARLHTRQVLWEWGLTALTESTELLVSELVTNAVRICRATEGDAPVRLWVVSDAAQVVILVWDASVLAPVCADPDDDAESGRGLLLVEAVSTRWGWDFPPGMGGKVVWAQLLADAADDRQDGGPLREHLARGVDVHGNDQLGRRAGRWYQVGDVRGDGTVRWEGDRERDRVNGRAAYRDARAWSDESPRPDLASRQRLIGAVESRQGRG